MNSSQMQTKPAANSLTATKGLQNPPRKQNQNLWNICLDMDRINQIETVNMKNYLKR